MNSLSLSIIIAIYNRAEELQELLESLVTQIDPNFEVIIIDDGSQINLLPCIEKYQSQLNLKYFYKNNTGPGLSRNLGVKHAKGNYLLFLDSDCMAPSNYIKNIKQELNKNYTDAFGGADMTHNNFNHLQKALSYSMTSVLTTGGIRGKKQSITKFQPRSFNMGISKEVFEKAGCFSELRIGEDPDLSMTLWEKGYSTRFLSSVKVFHKRRTSLSKFAKQIYQFGISRPILNQRHPNYNKFIFWVPSLFLIVSILAIILFFSYLFIIFKSIEIHYNFLILFPFILVIFYFFVLFIHSTYINKKIQIGILSVVTSSIQLYSYGYGFILSFLKLNVLKINPKKAFPSHFHT